MVLPYFWMEGTPFSYSFLKPVIDTNHKSIVVLQPSIIESLMVYAAVSNYTFTYKWTANHVQGTCWNFSVPRSHKNSSSPTRIMDFSSFSVSPLPRPLPWKLLVMLDWDSHYLIEGVSSRTMEMWWVYLWRKPTARHERYPEAFQGDFRISHYSA